MKKERVKGLAALLTAGILLAYSGCSLTTTRVTSETEQLVSYVDDASGTVSMQAGASGSAGQTTAQQANDGKTNATTGKESVETTASGIKNTSSNNAGRVDNKTEEKLTGSFELQIFVGGYGSECWEYAINEFQKLQPELEINAHLDTNVNAQMKTRWSKDTPPDFVFLEGTNMPKETWMKEGKLKDLSGLHHSGKVYGTSTLIKNQLKNGLVTKYANTSKIYEMPVLLSTYGMWYDQTLFSQKGWTVPKNFSELKSFSVAAKKSGVNPLIYTGQYSGYLVWGLLMPAVASEALASKDVQYFYDVANASRESVFADKRFRNVLTKLDELADAGYFNMSGLSMNHITSQAAWLQRGSALIPNGLWLENEMKDSTPKDFKMRYYPSMLQDAGQPTCVVASSATVGIASKAKNPKAAEAFLRFLYTDDVAKRFAELCAVPSAARTDMSGANLTESAKQVNQMINSAEVTLIAKGSTTWGSVDPVINDCVNQIVAGKYTVDKAIEELQKATRKKNG